MWGLHITRKPSNFVTTIIAEIGENGNFTESHIFGSFERDELKQEYDVFITTIMVEIVENGHWADSNIFHHFGDNQSIEHAVKR